jgi:hypothetical protein
VWCMVKLFKHVLTSLFKNRSLMVHIAEIYFRAWKKASGKMLEVFSFYLTFTVF